VARKLKVCLMVNDLRIGGAERQLSELARGLDRERFDVLVATLYPDGPLEPELKAAGVRLVSLNKGGKLDLRPVWRMAKLLRREKVDVLQPSLTPASFFGLTAALPARTPLTIVTERCGLRVNPGAGSNVFRFLEDRLTRFAGAAVPNSQAGASYLAGRGIDERKIRVIYNGVSDDRVTATEAEMAEARAKFGIPGGAKVVGIVASLQEAKDHRTFLRAAATVKQQHTGTHFVIVGDGELRAELEGLAKELGIGGSVTFTGNQARIAPIVALFDVSVLSSYDHEGCSNAILEAMGLGKPVVATNVGGNAELVTDGENGYVAPAQSPEPLAARVSELLTNPEQARAMGERGRERFRRDFTLPTMVKQYEDLYTELWERRSLRRAAQVAKEAQKA
jgi:glycosyltransferase involved in cell wall biosynthesis